MMAESRDMAFHPSSPPSEGGADSFRYEDTPDTRLSAFSPPDDSAAKSSRHQNALTLSTGTSYAQPVKFEVPIPNNNFALHRMGSIDSITSVIHDKDPFITSTPEKDQPQTKLSATASAFRPLSVAPGLVSGSDNSLATPKPLDRSVTSAVPVVCSPITGARVYNHVPLSFVFSKDLKLSRSVSITSATGVLTTDAVNEYLQKLQALGGPFDRYPDIFPCGNTAYLRLTNVRDSPRILNDNTVKPKEWKIEGVSALEINKGTGIGILANENEGLHNLLAYSSVGLSEAQIQDKITEHFKHWNVFALVKQPIIYPNVVRWIIELSDCNATYGCAAQLHARGWMAVDGVFWMLLAPLSPGGQSLPYFSLNDYARPSTAVSELTAQLDNVSLRSSQQPMQAFERSTISASSLSSPAQVSSWSGAWGFGTQSPQLVQSPYHNLLSRGTTPATSTMGVQMMIPVSPTCSMMGSSFSPPLSSSISTRTEFSSPRLNQDFQRSDARRQNASRVSRSHFSPPGPHHNHVDVTKIREGTDVRTTIMLRNIPNKVDQAMLKNIVDESSWGKYDFMYLRIDFANDCNVGYAFINFVDPLDIIDFVNARGNQRWNCFKSDKIAEISYATIQGKDCLVQKFRNSSVMLEAAHYRPKLYYTSNGPTPQMAGSEEPFPEPDNQSKMKRSCENAEHVGLFTPNAGQHFRDEQRRRRSQYDRGTRLAALEECGDYGMYSHPDAIH